MSLAPLDLLIITAAMAGPSIIPQGCTVDDNERTIIINQNMEITIESIAVPCPDCPGKTDTIYIEVPKNYHPEVNDSLVNKLDSIGFPPQGDGDLIGAFTGQIDWENNAYLTSTLNAKASSDDEMVFDNVKLKLDGKEFYGRISPSLTGIVPGEGKRILLNIEEYTKAPNGKPNDIKNLEPYGKLVMGKVVGGKCKLYSVNDDQNPIGYAIKEQNPSDPKKNDLVFYMNDGRITGISDFKVFTVSSQN